ncbi:PilX N-terminal domain-containing pilus assembly protein [Pseudomonas nitroreducens]|uniref:pilus assembly PilX family protein n=1 Tax=Pseudomonas TaxID=286 RepID=UPI001CF0241B|nr:MULTISPECIES: PilX N-terminal domain-containing pilus assembly protein [Pseudomonas]MDG9853665.1 PilX N-terminal domain-containing pilus assembly protein [Pseudomonas nitroreducens]MDH1076072.1 PilX N-terminal domain-containing pilus assembly protein [Pseudomonas nitroreducens]UCL88063.1 pilus assembly protein PilX [Pseudomonas sp. HS-18]
MKASRQAQQGAILFVSLIILLIVSLLAISSVRQSTLESRITGSVIEEKRLFNSAESGLRNTEATIATSMLPPDQCPSPAVLPCLWNKTPVYTQDFSDGLTYTGKGLYPAATDGITTAVTRYMISAPTGGSSGQTLNPEYGNMMLGTGTFMYEVNSRATSNGREVPVRSVMARVFNN